MTSLTITSTLKGDKMNYTIAPESIAHLLASSEPAETLVKVVETLPDYSSSTLNLTSTFLASNQPPEGALWHLVATTEAGVSVYLTLDTPAE